MISAMRTAVAAKMGVDPENVVVRKVQKNNGEMKNGLMVYHSGTKTVVPVVYVDEIISKWKKGMLALDEAADEISRIYRDAIHVSKKLDPEIGRAEILSQCIIQVVNADMNRAMIEETPHKRFLDLAAIVRAQIDVADSKNPGSFRVTKALIEQLGITEEELFDAAIRNTQENYPVRATSLRQTITNFMENDPDDEMEMADPPILVVTNDQMIYGASVMFWPEKIGEYADMIGSDVYILPSSIHEVLIHPASACIDPGDLKAMVREVNRTAVAHEDILSNNLYFFRRETRELTIV